MHLTSGARRLLRDVAQQLRSEPVVPKKRRKVVNEVVGWLDEQHIDPGSRLTHAWLRFDRELLAQMEGALALSGEAPLEINLSGLSTIEQARFGNREQKSLREKPREHRVLVSLPAVECPDVAERQRDFVDLDWRDIDRSAFDTLIQLENLDSFYVFETLPACTPRPLVAYRGDRHYGGGFAKLATAWAASTKPHLYCGDFDTVGIQNAISSSATHLLLPPLGWLDEHATGTQLASKQHDYQASLRQRLATLPEDHALAGYLKLLLGEQRGLLQQWFAADLVRVPLG
ncbi:MAG: hypothetical protein GX771_02765 [Halomonadaceae bacterium]|nr:hypothetical protein [Halomonadaceae bacterium]